MNVRRDMPSARRGLVGRRRRAGASPATSDCVADRSTARATSSDESAEERGPAIHVAVCVPTFRRPAHLATLMRALSRQVDAPAFAIVVGNNDRLPLSRDPLIFDDTLPPFAVIDVAERGVSAVRNALVAHVLARMDAAWIACIDDDQIPADDWLARLTAAGEAQRADLVGGPVARIAIDSTYWSASAADTSYLPSVAGPVESLNEAGNLLLSTAFLRTLDRPPFSTDFGRTGGEDYEFFLYARSRRARLAWAPDAKVDEPLRKSHLTFRGYLWRFYSIAAYQSRADRAYFGTWATLKRTLIEVGKTPLILGRSVLVERDPTRPIALLLRSIAIVTGRIAGLLGTRAERYGADG